jgi:hypothetical protein
MSRTNGATNLSAFLEEKYGNNGIFVDGRTVGWYASDGSLYGCHCGITVEALSNDEVRVTLSSNVPPAKISFEKLGAVERRETVQFSIDRTRVSSLRELAKEVADLRFIPRRPKNYYYMTGEVFDSLTTLASHLQAFWR